MYAASQLQAKVLFGMMEYRQIMDTRVPLMWVYLCRWLHPSSAVLNFGVAVIINVHLSRH
jgi:hypothetical protein